jgi:hypothetical protein
MGIVECLILIVVVGITFGAIFTTMAAATRSYAFSKQDKESRELLFSWIQTFEALWPGTYSVPKDKVDDAIEKTSNMLGGTWSGGKTHIRGYILTVADAEVDDGKLTLHVTIQGGDSRKALVDLTRIYNAFSNETVSDDAVS